VVEDSINLPPLQLKRTTITIGEEPTENLVGKIFNLEIEKRGQEMDDSGKKTTVGSTPHMVLARNYGTIVESIK
jgi:hypothetical protein